MVELLDFWAEWCGPCKVMEPVIEELGKELEGKVKVHKINVDKDPKKASQYGVQSIPTFIILKNNKEVERFVGVVSKETLKAKLLSQL